MVRSIALAVSVIWATGCLSSLGPEVGGEVAACEDVDSDPATDISFERDIRMGIFANPDIHCVKCHTPGGANPIGLTRSGLDLTSYTTLVAGGIRSRTDIVVAGKPCSSIIGQKISPAPPFGSRMPLDGPPYLTVAQQQIILDWIAEGAHDN